MRRKLKIFGFCNKGYNGQVFGIETDIRNGFPGFDIVGLADSAIRESRERVKTALRNCGFKFPNQRVLVSLSPASVPKSGSLLDLGIALSILFASIKDSEDPGPELKVMIAGELTLTGEVVPNSGAIGAVQAAGKAGCNLCLVPFDVPEEKNVHRVASLNSAFIILGEYLNSQDEIELERPIKKPDKSIFKDIIGMNREKETLCISAAGWHSTLLFGPPGVGKTMLSQRLHLLLPQLTNEEQKDVLQIYGCSDDTVEDPAHSTSQIVPHDCTLNQFVGGTLAKSPGLGALAHCGTLILDEINKYTPNMIEAAKDAYDKGITISSRSGETITYPARFLMISNLNPCPCGGLGSEHSVCKCTSQRIDSHWRKIGKAMLERFDIRLPIPEYDLLQQSSEPVFEDTYYIDRISCAVDRQAKRFENTKVRFNGQAHYISNPFSVFTSEVRILASMKDKIQNISNARSQISMISIARTIADLDDRAEITEEDLFKAAKLRQYGSDGDYYWRVIG